MCGGQMTQPPAMEVIEAPGTDDMEQDIFNNGRDEMEVSELRCTDILCGRGNGVAAHPGNKMFREIVRAHKVAYLEAPRHCKAKIAADVIKIIENQNPPGRFLDRLEEDRFLIVSPSKALEKTSQALREKPTVRSSSSRGSSVSLSSADDKASVSSIEGDPLLLGLEQRETSPVVDHLLPYSGNRFFPYPTPVPRPLARSLALSQQSMACDYSTLAVATALTRQRRVVCSQGLSAVHSAGLSAPPSPLSGMKRSSSNESQRNSKAKAARPLPSPVTESRPSQTPTPSVPSKEPTKTSRVAKKVVVAPQQGQFDDPIEPHLDTSLSLFHSYSRGAHFR